MLKAISPELAKPDRVRPISDSDVEFVFQAPARLLRKLERIKSLVAHQNPNPTQAELFEMLADFFLETKDPEKSTSPERWKSTQNPNARIPNKKLQKEVFRRDQGQCTYADPITGRRCQSRYALQIDHIQPYALFGETKLENLRLLCRTHNRYAAMKVF